MELDPSQFLAQGSSDDDDSDSEEINNRLSNGNVEPPILTSLGLTHINNVQNQNPYSSYAVSWLLIF